MGCRNRLIALGFVLLFIGRSSIYIASSACFFVPPHILAGLEHAGLKDGDVILRKGRSMVSGLIARTLEGCEDMSHCGIIIAEQGQYYVVHTISGQISAEDGIRKTPLLDFVAQADKHKVLILRPQAEINIAKIRHHTLALLAQKVPFDHNFDHHDNSKLYCSELIRDVFVASGATDFFLISSRFGITYLDFQTFFDEDRFNRIYQSYM